MARHAFCILTCLMMINHGHCLLWLQSAVRETAVCFLGDTTGSVCRGEAIHSVIVGHHDRDQRNDVLRINKPAALSHISFILLFNLSLCHYDSRHKPNPETKIMCCLCNMCQLCSFLQEI